MDSLEKIREEEIIDKFLFENAKYKKFSFVGYRDSRDEIIIGMVVSILISYKQYESSNKIFNVIVYNLVTPFGEILKEEGELDTAENLLALNLLKLKNQI